MAASHTHRHVIIVGNAPVVMMAGKRLPIRRACACGDTIVTGYYTAAAV
jgi:hypothetical protein